MRLHSTCSRIALVAALVAGAGTAQGQQVTRNGAAATITPAQQLGNGTDVLDAWVIPQGFTLSRNGNNTAIFAQQNVNGVVATITNSGSLIQTDNGRVIEFDRDQTSLTFTLVNEATGVIRSFRQDAIDLRRNPSAGAFSITNRGVISGGTNEGRAIDLDGSRNGAFAKTIVNASGASLTAPNDDAIRTGDMATRATGAFPTSSFAAVGSNASAYASSVRSTLEGRFTFSGSVTNAGTISSASANSQVQTSLTPGGPPVDTTLTSTINNDAITGQSIRVVNQSGGTISGFRHAIDGAGPADSNAPLQDRLDTAGILHVTNAAGATIIGNNGSGVGSDGHGVVINRGTILGRANGYLTGVTGTPAADQRNRGGDGDGVDIDFIAYVENYGVIEGRYAYGDDSGGRANGADGIAAGGGAILNFAGARITGGTNAILIDDGANGDAVAATYLYNEGTIEALGEAGRGGTAPSDPSATRIGQAVTFVGPFGDVIVNAASGVIRGAANPNTGRRIAVSTGAGNDAVTNAGSIVGDVQLGAGEDRLSNSGVIEGAADGGTGTDTLVISGNGRITGQITGFERIEVAAGGAEAAGSVYAETTTAALSIGKLFGAVVGSRLADVRAGRISSAAAAPVQLAFAGDPSEFAAVARGPSDTAQAPSGAAQRPWTVWVRPVAGVTHRDGDAGTGDARTRAAGVMVGADRAVAEGVRLGAAAGYARGRLDQGSAETVIDVYQAQAYGTATAGRFFADAAVGFAVNRYDSERALAGGSAEGETRALAYSGDVGVGLVETLGGVSVEPRAGLRWDRVETDGFTETGAGALSVTTADATQTTLQSSLGVRASLPMARPDGGSIEPSVSVAWLHDFRSTASVSENRIAGFVVPVRGSDPGRNGAQVGVGLTAQTAGGLWVDAGWRSEFRSGEQSHGVFATLALRF